MILLHKSRDPSTCRTSFTMEVDDQFLARIVYPVPEGDLEPDMWMGVVVLIFQEAKRLQSERLALEQKP